MDKIIITLWLIAGPLSITSMVLNQVSLLHAFMYLVCWVCLLVQLISKLDK